MAAARTLSDLRAHAVSQSLFPQTTLRDAIDRLGFVQADPIRSPARAQDLILRPRVRGYHAGDLERHYASLDIEEDTCTPTDFCRSRSGSCCIRESARLFARSKKRCSKRS